MRQPGVTLLLFGTVIWSVVGLVTAISTAYVMGLFDIAEFDESALGSIPYYIHAFGPMALAVLFAPVGFGFAMVFRSLHARLEAIERTIGEIKQLQNKGE